MNLYHVLNRGVDKRSIFMDSRDYVRFIHDLWEFNDKNEINTNHRHSQNTDFVSPYLEKERIVDIHGWCLMKNHYHLLLSERVQGGITKFIRRLNIGYAKYFNERHERVGTLFQGRTKKILIDSNSHFLHILHYIHLNPLDYFSRASGWRDHRVANVSGAFSYLDKYRWSSYLDYSKIKNFPSVLTTDLFNNVFQDYRKDLLIYLREMELEGFKKLFLE